MTFVFNNLSDQAGAHLHINTFAEGSTWHDILNLAAEGAINSPPGGLRKVYIVSVEGNV